jgi:Flp pilus assembly pilin Flp
MTQRWGASLWKFGSDSKGQDLIEYALMLGFVAVAAGAVLPGTAASIGVLFSRVGSAVKTADSSSDETLKQQQPIQIPCGSGGEPESYRLVRSCDSTSPR